MAIGAVTALRLQWVPFQGLLYKMVQERVEDGFAGQLSCK
jgi:hypothetical protein